MASLREITGYLDQVLDLAGIPDYPQALNGLQLENGGEVTRVVAAVDACLPVVEQAVKQGADLLVVHHGLFWQGARRIEAGYYRKLKLCRNQLRELASQGLIPGMTKSSW